MVRGGSFFVRCNAFPTDPVEPLKTIMTTNTNPDVVAGIKALQAALGDDLAKQVYSDASAADRQTARNHFEARMEYARQIAQINLAAEISVKEYGLQTLKWLFLLNAGAIALVLTYIGAKSPEGKVAPVASLALATWPFMVGCVCVVLAGALSFFNFSYASGSLPSVESLHKFLDPTSMSWPTAKMQNAGEDIPTFFSRFARKVGLTRSIAIGLAVGSVSLFCYGVFRVLRVLLS
jgi:hypothetical protein